MKNLRQKKILQLIDEYEISTQDELVPLLTKEGFKVTQATISRDIKELQLIKTLSNTGKYKYTMPLHSATEYTNRFINIFRETILSVQSAGNIVLIKTLSGCGNAAAEAIDSLSLDHTLGCVAGDNTIMLLIESEEYTANVVETLTNL